MSDLRDEADMRCAVFQGLLSDGRQTTAGFLFGGTSLLLCRSLALGRLKSHLANTMRTDSTALLEVVKPMLAQVGEEPTGISFLAKGATCEVWRLVSGNRSYALRLFLEEDRILDGRLDAFIRHGVIERGGAVVAPLLDSESLDQKLQGKRWTLEPYVEGHHPQRGGLPQTVCAKLGETLAALHDIPADKYGRPSEVSSQVVVGSKARDYPEFCALAW